MSVEIHIDTRKSIATIVVVGEIPVATYSCVVDQLIATPGFQRSMNSLIDLRRAELIVAPDDIGVLAESLLTRQMRRGHSFRTALLVGSDFAFGVCRMISVALEQVPIWCRVVRTPDDAYAWVLEADEWLSDCDTA